MLVPTSGGTDFREEVGGDHRLRQWSPVSETEKISLAFDPRVRDVLSYGSLVSDWDTSWRTFARNDPLPHRSDSPLGDSLEFPLTRSETRTGCGREWEEVW